MCTPAFALTRTPHTRVQHCTNPLHTHRTLSEHGTTSLHPSCARTSVSRSQRFPPSSQATPRMVSLGRRAFAPKIQPRGRGQLLRFNNFASKSAVSTDIGTLTAVRYLPRGGSCNHKEPVATCRTHLLPRLEIRLAQCEASHTHTQILERRTSPEPGASPAPAPCTRKEDCAGCLDRRLVECRHQVKFSK